MQNNYVSQHMFDKQAKMSRRGAVPRCRGLIYLCRSRAAPQPRRAAPRVCRAARLSLVGEVNKGALKSL